MASQDRFLLGRYENISLAHLHASLLEAEGIPTHVLDEATAGLHYGHGQAIGNFKLVVAEHDYVPAQEILRAHEAQRLKDLPQLTPEEYAEKERRDFIHVIGFAGVLGLIFPLIFFAIFWWHRKVFAHQRWSDFTRGQRKFAFGMIFMNLLVTAAYLYFFFDIYR